MINWINQFEDKNVLHNPFDCLISHEIIMIFLTLSNSVEKQFF